jgi:hypothetical protein
MYCLPETEAAQNFYREHWVPLLFSVTEHGLRSLLRNGKSDPAPPN